MNRTFSLRPIGTTLGKMHISIRTRILTLFFACAIFFACVSRGNAQAPATAPADSALASSIVQPMFPLSQVRAGLHGTAYTVFEGSKPEPIDVEVLGVLRDAIGPDKDMILIRLDGSKSEHIGVAAGMSGSPVYIDGKLAGAIGYRIGQFTKEPIAGVTPIEQMLEVFTATQKKNSPIAVAASPENLASSISSTSSVLPQDSGMLRPIETPLTFDGFSPVAVHLFEQHAPSLGLAPVSGLGGANPEQPDPAPVVPGSAISAIIVSGDFNMAATCTVTYVDPTRLLACGHPITRFGDISLPMTKSVVVTTIASSLDPMKVINTTQTVGSFTEDRASGILGIFGKPAHMIPVTLAIRGNRAPRTYHFAVADHSRLTSAALVATIYQAIQDANSYSDPATYDLQGKISIAGYPDVKIDDWVAPKKQQPASLEAAVAISQRFDGIFDNPRQLPQIQSVSLTVNAISGEHSAELADANVLNPVVHAGDRLTIEAILHPYRQPPRTVRVETQLPATLSPGPVRLLVSDGATLDHTLHLLPSSSAPALSLGDTIARLNQLHPADKLYVTLLAPVPQATLQGRDLPAVPLTMANVLQPDEGGADFTINGETAIPLGSTPLDLALTGAEIVTLNVQP